MNIAEYLRYIKIKKKSNNGDKNNEEEYTVMNIILKI